MRRRRGGAARVSPALSHARRYQNRTLELGMDALPTMEGEMVGVLLFKPRSEAYHAIEALRDADGARRFFASAMPPLLPYLRDEELRAR